MVEGVNGWRGVKWEFGGCLEEVLVDGVRDEVRRLGCRRGSLFWGRSVDKVRW